MKLLLDTHTFIWSTTGDPRLGPSTLALLADPANDLFLSPVCVYEMAIKVRLGKLDLPLPLPEFVAEGIRRSGLTEYPVLVRHSVAALSLPLHHRDPFDRWLIATAVADDLALVTSDAEIGKYSVAVVW